MYIRDEKKQRMNISVIIIETICFIALFTAMILIPLFKNPVWWIHDYPEDIQEEYFKTHERIPSAFFSKTVLLKKSIGLVIALVILVAIIWSTGAQTFWEALAVSYGMWLVIDWYDCFILDWLIFANARGIRLPGTEHMDKAYHQKKYHFVRSLYGMIIGLIPCLMAAALFALIK